LLKLILSLNGLYAITSIQGKFDFLKGAKVKAEATFFRNQGLCLLALWMAALIAFTSIANVTGGQPPDIDWLSVLSGLPWKYLCPQSGSDPLRHVC
jgi:hypothetical protein